MLRSIVVKLSDAEPINIHTGLREYIIRLDVCLALLSIKHYWRRKKGY